MKTAEEILKEHFIPFVCSIEYFNHCIENNNVVTAPPQAIKAMGAYHAQFSQQPTEKSREDLYQIIQKYLPGIHANDLTALLAEYHAQFSQQPTEKTREGAIKVMMDRAAEFTTVTIYKSRIESLIDALIQSGYIQSDSVDVEQALQTAFKKEWGNPPFNEKEATHLAMRHMFRAGFTAGLSSKVKPVNNDGWIPVEKELPKTIGEFNVVINGHSTFSETFKFYNEITEKDEIGFKHAYVTHWLPNPSPPKV